MAVRGRPTVTYKGKTEKLQKIISTRKYDFMMPNILVVDIRWANQHRDYLNTLFRIVARSNEKIQEDPSYFRSRIAPLNTLVFNMESATFWDKYFKGTVENGVPLGGSRVNNISEIRHLFGMDQNVSVENSVFGITYRSHGERLKTILPDRLAEVIPVSEIVDTSFIRDITDEKTTSTNYQANFAESSSDRVAVNANYQINFDNNSAAIRPSEYSKLQDLMGLLIRAGNTKIAIEGHTDTSGDVNHNVALSQRRAQAVWQWLLANDRSGVISQQRLIGQPQGYGPYRILEGKAPTDPLNRRVSVTLH
jgi:outer membrane protein OmpA-like peptidoglycan-associated protein